VDEMLQEPTALSPRKGQCYPLIKKLSGYQNQCGWFGYEINHCPFGPFTLYHSHCTEPPELRDSWERMVDPEMILSL